MTQGELATVLEAIVDDLEGGTGAWQFTLGGVRMACFADPSFDRMRVIAPIIEADEFTAEEKDAALEANFHTALDARYCTSEGVVYAAFIHPLSPLGAQELRSAVEQVANLVLTFGTTYNGGNLIFGAGGGSDPESLN